MLHKRLITMILTLILLSGTTSPAIYADEAAVTPATDGNFPNVTVITDVTMSLLNGRIDIIDSFETPAAVTIWSPSVNTDTVTAEASFSGYPFEPLEGSHFLNVAGSDADASMWRYIDCSFDKPLDLTGYNTFFYAMSCPRLSGGATKTALTLYSSSGSVYNVTADLTSDSWNGIFADISAFDGRSEISRITIGIRNGENVGNPYSFQVDCVAASHDRALARAVSFMSSDYLVYGGESRLTYLYDPMKMSLGIASTLASKCFIESGILTKDNFTAQNAVRIRLVNNSLCTSITMEYATSGSPVYTDNEPVNVNITSGSTLMAYYFTLPAGDVTQVKFTFNGASEGSVDIYSITPVAYYTPLSEEYAALVSTKGSVTSCRLTEDGRKIVIGGTLTDVAVSAYSNSRIELYELLPWQSNEYIFSSESQPIASTGVSSLFSIEITSADEGRSRVCSRFAVVINNKDKKLTILLDAPHYITNPEITSVSSWKYPTLTDKGLTGTFPVLAEAGVSQTAVEVNAGAMLTASKDGIVYDFENTEYYFDTDYITALDAKTHDLYTAGVSPVLLLSLTGSGTGSGQTEYAAQLTHRDAIAGTQTGAYAFNTDTEKGVTCLRVISDFLAHRYMTDDTTHGRVLGITVGNSIDKAYSNYNMGKKTLAAFADNYSRTFRIIYNTVRSVSGRVRVYVSTGNSWDLCLTTDAALRYCGRDLVDIIGEQFRREGNIAWQLAVNPYSLYSDGITDWKAGETAVLSTVTMKNLASLCTYLKRDKLLYENTSRHILLLSTEPGIRSTQISAERHIAEYIASYYTISADTCTAVDGYILNDSTVYKSPQYSFYQILKYIDTDRAAEFTDFAKYILGITEWNEIIAGYRSGANAGRLLYENKLSDNLPDMITGTAALCSFNTENDTGGWFGSSGLISLTAANNIKGYKDMMFAGFGSLPQGSLCAIADFFDYTRDLSYAPYITFNIYTDNLPDTVRSLILTVTVTAEGSSIESKSELRGGAWRYVVCDLSDFTDIKNVNGITFRLDAPGGDDLSGVTLVIGEISVSSLKYDNNFLENKFKEERDKYLSVDLITMNSLLIRVLISTIVTALTVEILYYLNRIRRINTTNRKNEKQNRYKF